MLVKRLKSAVSNFLALILLLATVILALIHNRFALR